MRPTVPCLFALFAASAAMAAPAAKPAATPAASGSYESAFTAYQKGDYATALKLMKPLAEGGNVNAQYNVGAMYNNALGVKADHTEAAKWYKMAVAKGKIGRAHV